MRVITWYLPTFDGDLNGSFVTSLLNNTLRALHYILDMRMFLAVPVLDGTDAHSTAYAENVIASYEGATGEEGGGGATIVHLK